MKRIICNHCKTETIPDTYGLAPVGWYALSRRGQYTESPDYCSARCLIDASIEQQEKENQAVKEKEQSLREL